MKIDEKIRTIRKSRSLSQEEMAEKINMSVNGYAKIEQGKTIPSIPKLQQIAAIFNIDLLELLCKDKNVYLINGDGNHGCNVIGSTTEIAYEMQKLQMQLSHKDEIIEQLRNENKLLKDMVELMKKDD